MAVNTSVNSSVAAPARGWSFAPWIGAVRGTATALWVLPPLGALVALALAPRIRLQDTLFSTFVAVIAVLAGWFGLLVWQRLRQGRALETVVSLTPAHYVQTSVQLSIYIYWSFYWNWINHAAPLILGQILFAYLFDALLSWSRGRPWRIGFGPIPITFSTNLFLCFRDDWFYYQFAVIAVALLAKEFITWERDGRRTHIFNPSAFPLFVASIVLLAAGATDITWAQEIAVQLNNPPHIYLWIFVVGLIVQGLFQVTLVTLGAGLALGLANLLYTAFTGSYWFLDAGIPIAVFLGMHLLVTDPATSPRNNTGRLTFGFLYGVSVFALYGLLEHFGQPSYFDKLLCVPVLNLLVIALERWGARRGPVARRIAATPLGAVADWSAGAQNRLAMAVWIALFAALYALQIVGPRHPGQEMAFWQQACADNRPGACVRQQRIHANRCVAGSTGDCQRLAAILSRSPEHGADRRRLVASTFACEYGSFPGCRQAAAQLTPEMMQRLEGSCSEGDGLGCYVAGAAKLKGTGVSQDLASARQRFLRACEARFALGCALVGDLHYHGVTVPRDVGRAESYWDRACLLGYAPSCRSLEGATGSPSLAAWYRAKACAIGQDDACD